VRGSQKYPFASIVRPACLLGDLRNEKACNECQPIAKHNLIFPSSPSSSPLFFLSPILTLLYARHFSTAFTFTFTLLVPGAIGNPIPFVVMYSVGNVLNLLSSMFLVGPRKQLRQMVGKKEGERG